MTLQRVPWIQSNRAIEREIAMPDPSPDLATVKQRQQRMWSSGDFAVVATATVIVGELLCEAADLRAGSTVLDVACGSGNTSLAAARRNCTVTGLDYVPALLDRARQRAAAERLAITFIEGDAEALPFEDASFDVVLSTFGVMFAPDQGQAARELLRVTRPGGTIGLACWTPDSRSGEMFRLTAQFVPPPPGVPPANRWGTEAGLNELLGDGVTGMSITRRESVVRLPSPKHWVDQFRTYFGPVRQTFDALAPEDQDRYEAALLELTGRYNRADDGTLVLPSSYLEVVAHRA
jgi:SAM-dependent methyltransferase